MRSSPSTRPDFWRAKFRGNVARDRRVREELLDSGWRVAIIWECALGTSKETVLSMSDPLGGSFPQFLA